MDVPCQVLCLYTLIYTQVVLSTGITNSPLKPFLGTATNVYGFRGSVYDMCNLPNNDSFFAVTLQENDNSVWLFNTTINFHGQPSVWFGHFEEGEYILVHNLPVVTDIYS